jgi:hypothetical protein
MFFVNVASKGFSPGVSLLFATLTGRFISVADKGVAVNKNRRNTGRPCRGIWDARDASERGNDGGSRLCSGYTKKDSMEV